MIKNLRKGVAMLDLVFVIVILAILSAVAVPYMYNVTEDAHEAVARSMVDAANARLMVFGAEAEKRVNIDSKSIITNLKNDSNANYYLEYSHPEHTIVGVNTTQNEANGANGFTASFTDSTCKDLLNILVQGITDNQHTYIVSAASDSTTGGGTDNVCTWTYTP